MLLLRKILFLVFLIIYVVACPLLILYSLGYIFSPLKPGLTQTGLAYLSSIPSGADIFLGRSRFAKKTPSAIPDILPGTYAVGLRLKGHKPWRRSVNIEAGKAEAFENILLLPYSWRPQIIDRRLFRTMMPLEGTDFMLLATGTTLKEYFIFDWKKGAVKGIIPEDSGLSLFPVSSVFTREKSPRLIVYGGPLLKRSYLLFDASVEEPYLKDISRLFLSRPQYLDWSPQAQENILSFYQGRLDLLNSATLGIYPKYLEDIKGYGLYDKWLYYLDPEDNIGRISLEKKQQETISRRAFGSGTLPGRSSFYNIRLLKSGLFLFLSNKGQLLINVFPHELEEGGVAGVSLNKYGPLFVYWTRRKITVVDFPQESDGAEPKVLYDGGRDIKQCLWAIDNNHIIFRDGDLISLLETFPQGGPRVEPLFKVKSNTSFFYSDETNSLYYLRHQDGALCRIDMLNR